MLNLELAVGPTSLFHVNNHVVLFQIRPKKFVQVNHVSSKADLAFIPVVGVSAFLVLTGLFWVEINSQIIEPVTIASAGLISFAILILRRYLQGYEKKLAMWFLAFPLCWFAAEIIWTVQDPVATKDYPPFADMLWIVGYAALITFFTLLLKEKRKSISVNIVVLVTSVSASLLIPMMFGVLKLPHDLSTDTILAIAYPIMDVVLLTESILLWALFSKSKVSKFFAWFSTGLMSLFVADLLFFELLEEKIYFIGNPVDGTFAVSYLLMLTAVYYAIKYKKENQEENLFAFSLNKKIQVLKSHDLMIPTIILTTMIVTALTIIDLTFIDKIDSLQITISEFTIIAILSSCFVSLALYLVRRNLTNTIRDLEKTDRLKNEFLSMISHDLKTPLVPIKVYVDMMINGKLGPINELQSNRLLLVKKNSDFLMTLLSDLVDAQKIEIGELGLTRAKHNLKNTIADVLDTWSDIMQQKKITLRSELLEIECYYDAKRIIQVISNLISNAIDFCPQESGQITVSMSKERHFVRVTVKDNGKGIEKSNLEKVFVKFYQEDSPYVREHGSNGLGLSVCRGILDAHQGKIWAESEGLGKGIQVHFTIPMSSEFETI